MEERLLEKERELELRERELEMKNEILKGVSNPPDALKSFIADRGHK